MHPILWPVACMGVFIVTIIINALSSTGILTGNSVGKIAQDHPIQLLPSNWTFSIWGFIYTWQFLLIMYLIYFVFVNKSQYFSTYFYVYYILANVFNCLWLYIWCSDYLGKACIIIILLTVCLYVSDGIAYQKIYSNIVVNENVPNTQVISNSEVKKVSKTQQFYLVALVINGLIFYSTWTSIATSLNLAIVLRYNLNFSDEKASLISLGLLTILLIIYAILDFIVFPTYLAKTFSNYPVLVVACIGILTNHKGEIKHNPAQIWVIVLLVVSIIFLLLKLGRSTTKAPFRNEFQRV